MTMMSRYFTSVFIDATKRTRQPCIKREICRFPKQIMYGRKAKGQWARRVRENLTAGCCQIKHKMEGIGVATARYGAYGKPVPAAVGAFFVPPKKVLDNPAVLCFYMQRELNRKFNDTKLEGRR